MTRTRLRSLAPVLTLLSIACTPEEGRDIDPAGGLGLSFGGQDGSEGSDTETSGTGSDPAEDTASTDPSAGESGDEATCEAPVLDPRRALIETDQAVLASWTLAEVLAAVATNAGLTPDPSGTHGQLFDTYRSGESGQFPGPHCDDGGGLGGEAEGGGTLNGFPLLCPRPEGAFASFDGGLDGWMAIAIVNRVDLAPADGSHCGEQRIVFANPNMVGRAFIIFEAQIPNPAPACGVAACGPIAEAWAELDAIDDPAQRSARLRAAFLTGEPTLDAAGFGPFMSADNLTFGSGQLRTNNFVMGPWTLREYKLVPRVEGGQTVVRAQPIPVAASPHEAIWNDLDGQAVGPACRSAILDALPGLLVDDIATMGFSLPEACLDAESVEGTGFYDAQLAAGSGSFTAALHAEIQALIPGSSLKAADVARRAQFSGSCIGCHEHGSGIDLGGGLVAPASLGFVHVDEERVEPCGDGQCFAISPALRDVLLPHRMEVLTSLLVQTCEDGCVSEAPAPSPGHALPPLGLDLAQLQAIDAAGRPHGLTLGGQPVGAGH